MKKIWIIFFITFILISCSDNNINNSVNKITIDSDVINISEVENQPNF